MKRNNFCIILILAATGCNAHEQIHRLQPIHTEPMYPQREIPKQEKKVRFSDAILITPEPVIKTEPIEQILFFNRPINNNNKLFSCCCCPCITTTAGYHECCNEINNNYLKPLCEISHEYYHKNSDTDSCCQKSKKVCCISINGLEYCCGLPFLGCFYYLDGAVKSTLTLNKIICGCNNNFEWPNYDK